MAINSMLGTQKLFETLNLTVTPCCSLTALTFSQSPFRPLLGDWYMCNIPEGSLCTKQFLSNTREYYQQKETLEVISKFP